MRLHGSRRFEPERRDHVDCIDKLSIMHALVPGAMVTILRRVMTIQCASLHIPQTSKLLEDDEHDDTNCGNADEVDEKM